MLWLITLYNRFQSNLPWRRSLATYWIEFAFFAEAVDVEPTWAPVATFRLGPSCVICMSSLPIVSSATTRTPNPPTQSSPGSVTEGD